MNNNITIKYPTEMTPALSIDYESKLDALQKNDNVVLDLSKTNYIDSTTIGSLINFKKRMEGKLEIKCSNEIYYILVKTGIVDYLNIRHQAQTT